MLDFNRVLIPVDFSDFSRRTLEVCSKLFLGQSTKEFHFLYVWQAPYEAVEWDHDPRADLTARLDEFIAGFSHENVHTRHAAIQSGHPANEICRYADEHQCDLIVLATHGRTGLRHMLIGSCAEQVVRHASVPVLTVRHKD